MPQFIHQQPILPWEITDFIIDHLHDDLSTLGVCSSVCSDWLSRSRYHIFSTVQIWPRRAGAFFALVAGKSCTFSNYITRVELDALPPPSKSLCNTAGLTHSPAEKATGDIVDATLAFGDAIGQPHLARLAGVRSIVFRNIDWTAMTPTQQRMLRNRLAELVYVRKLEFIDVTFHDLREVVRIVESFPELEHLKAGVAFTKYLDYAVGSAATLPLPNQLRSLELGTESSIPVVLTSLNAQRGPQSVSTLTLKDIQAFHLPYIHSALHQGGPNMQHVSLAFGYNRKEHISAGKHWHQNFKGKNSRRRKGDFASWINFSSLSHLQTLSISGIVLGEKKQLTAVETCLVAALSTIESSFLECISLNLCVQTLEGLTGMSWGTLERVLLSLHFFGMSNVRVQADVGPGLGGHDVCRGIIQRMPDLDAHGTVGHHSG